MGSKRRFWTARDNTKEALDKRRHEAIVKTTRQRAFSKAKKEYDATCSKGHPTTQADTPDAFIAALQQPLKPIAPITQEAEEPVQKESKSQLAKALKASEREERCQRMKEHAEKVRADKRKRFITKKRLDLRTSRGQLKLGALSEIMLQKLTKGQA